jgi:hypothetical protein
MSDGQVNAPVSIEGLANGTYLVILTVEGERTSQRLVVSR